MDKYNFDDDQDFLDGLKSISDNPSPELLQSAKEFYFNKKHSLSFKDVVTAIKQGKADSLPFTDKIPDTVIDNQPSISHSEQPKKPWE